MANVGLYNIGQNAGANAAKVVIQRPEAPSAQKANNISTPARIKSDDVKAPAAQEKRTQPADNVRTERDTRALDEEQGRVVSRSDDGDTVRVSEVGEEKLEDDRFGKVVSLNDDDEDAAQTVGEKAREQIREAAERIANDGGKETQSAAEMARKAEERRAHIMENIREEGVGRNDEKARTIEIEVNRDLDEAAGVKRQTNSFAGVSDSDLERMYRTGEISKADYDKEMNAREARETEQGENAAQVSQTLAADQALLRQAQNAATAINAAFNEDSAQTPDASARIKAMTAIEDIGLPNANER